ADGDAYPLSELTAMYEEAGFGGIMAHPIPMSPHTVVMGGLHVSACAEEALQHCNAAAVGEGEVIWPRILEDFRRGTLGGAYRADEEFDLADAPIPRFDLLSIEKYNRLTVQTSRGCPHKCEFCASSIQLTKRYKVKPVEKILAEVEAIKRLWNKPFIEFADDNSFVNRVHAKDLMRGMIGQRVQWFTEVDVSIAEDEDLLIMMREAGCRQLLIGLESPRAEGLDGLEQRANWKLKQFDKYEWAIRRIQAHGITVNACFILGLDADGPEVFDNVHEFVQRTNPFDVQLTVQTPFPGTALHERLLKAGRLIEPGNWNTCTLFDVNFVPAKMSAEELQWGLIGLAGRVYAPEAVRARRQRFFEEADRRKIVSAMPRTLRHSA
ncbi:MAG TPA: radical SAM protein, partial [Phycisphaerales bacterium]|nr:radical SAM protein [Phycisphaerales bacterium]